MDELRAVIAEAVFGSMDLWEDDLAHASPYVRQRVERVADAVLAAIRAWWAIVPLDWIAEKRTEAVTERDTAVFSSFDRGYWDGCENQLCEILTTFGPDADLARDVPEGGVGDD